MKWFKHDTDAFMSEGVDTLIEKYGFEGYGRWCRILEMVAFKMDQSDRCHVEYSGKHWRKMLGIYHHRLLEDYLQSLVDLFSISVQCNDNLWRISIPNLLKKRDKYTKDLQKKGQSLTPKIVDVEVDVDKENKDIVGGEIYREIIDYLNATAGTAFKPTSRKTQDLIKTRMVEGFTVDDFKTVIKTKWEEWGKDPKMCKFLRPETLFSNKFEGYLNQKAGSAARWGEE